jgi:hypothetical protein
MTRSLIFSLVAAAMLTATTGAAQAQPVASLAKASVSHAAVPTAGLVEVGWKSKRRAGVRHRSVRRAHRNSRRGFRGNGRRAAMTPYVLPGVASMLIQRRKCLDALFPASDPACN